MAKVVEDLKIIEDRLVHIVARAEGASDRAFDAKEEAERALKDLYRIMQEYDAPRRAK
jgi:hypothetical protein